MFVSLLWVRVFNICRMHKAIYLKPDNLRLYSLKLSSLYGHPYMDGLTFKVNDRAGVESTGSWSIKSTGSWHNLTVRRVGAVEEVTLRTVLREVHI